MNLPELLKIADNEAVNACEWVTEEWANEHFGSSSEAKFVATFSPAKVSELLKRLQEAEKKVEDFRSIVVKAMEEEDASWTGDFKYPANLALCSALNRIDAALLKGASNDQTS